MRGTLSMLLSAGLLAVTACGGGGDSSGMTPPGDDDGMDGGANVTAEMTIEDNAFVDPQGRRNENASVTINAGEAVRWTYVSSGSATHTVESGEGTGGDAGDGIPDGASSGESLNSDTMNPGDTYTYTFDTPGTWTYYCEVHPGVMFEATVVVQ